MLFHAVMLFTQTSHITVALSCISLHLATAVRPRPVAETLVLSSRRVSYLHMRLSHLPNLAAQSLDLLCEGLIERNQLGTRRRYDPLNRAIT